MAARDTVAKEHSPWKLGGLSLGQLAPKAWQGIMDDDVLGRAGELAYFFFFAIFPLLFFLTAMLGVVAGPGSPLAVSVSDYVTRAMPSSASGLVHRTMQHTMQSSGGGKLTFGIVLALLSASSGMGAMMDTLNGVFGVKEGRSILKQRAIALWLTVATGLLICIAIGLIVVGGNLAHAVENGALYWVWQIVQYPVAIFFLLLSNSVIYYFAPNVEHPEWHWVTPGAVVGVFMWIAVSFALLVYLHFFNTYTATYGALGGVMILLLWFYVTGMAFLTGGEINAVIERAATGKMKQHEPPEEKPARKVEQQKAEQQAQREVNPERAA